MFEFLLLQVCCWNEFDTLSPVLFAEPCNFADLFGLDVHILIASICVFLFAGFKIGR